MKTFLWVSASLLWLGVGLLSLVPVMFLPMLFDSPGSQDSQPLQAFSIAVLATPVLCLMAVVLPWVLQHKKHAGWLFLLPPLGIPSIFLLALLLLVFLLPLLGISSIFEL